MPDGKLIAYNNEITISIEEGIDRDVLEYLDIIKPTIFKKSGANADSGTVGRKLIAERHGNGVPHGGGEPLQEKTLLKQINHLNC